MQTTDEIVGRALCGDMEALNWAKHQSPAPTLNGIAYGSGQFVVVGYESFQNNTVGTIVASFDGVKWASRRPAIGPLSGIAYGNGPFVAVGWDGTTVTSAGGANWVVRQLGTRNWISGIAYGDGHFVVVGSRGSILQSGSIINLKIRPNTATGLLSLSLEGPTGLDFTIQTSSDLVSWRDVTKIGNAQSSKVILDGLPASSDRQFYRATSQ
jgi:hypothetical protein